MITNNDNDDMSIGVKVAHLILNQEVRVRISYR